MQQFDLSGYEFGKVDEFLKDAIKSNMRIGGALMNDIISDDSLPYSIKIDLGETLLKEFYRNKKILIDIGELPVDSTETQK